MTFNFYITNILINHNIYPGFEIQFRLITEKKINKTDKDQII